MKAKKKPIAPQLGSTDYEGIATYLQETLEGSMTMIVSPQTEMKSALDMKIMELKTLLERALQISTVTTSTSGTP